MLVFTFPLRSYGHLLPWKHTHEQCKELVCSINLSREKKHIDWKELRWSGVCFRFRLLFDFYLKLLRLNVNVCFLEIK